MSTINDQNPFGAEEEVEGDQEQDDEQALEPVEENLPAVERDDSESEAAPDWAETDPTLSVPEDCDIHLTITLRRDDGNPAGRQVLLGARNDQDYPLITLIRAPDLPAVFAPLQALYERLQAELPERQRTLALRQEAVRTRQQEHQATARHTRRARTHEAGSSTAAVSAPASSTSRQTRKRAPSADAEMEQLTLF